MRNAPASEYVDPQIFGVDRAAIFERTWQLVGPASALSAAGDYRAIDVCGMAVVVVRGRDGVLRGFRNVCRHRGAKLLSDGDGHCPGVIQCPYHLWVYGDDGALRSTSWFGDDPTFDPADWPLDPVAVEVWRGLVFAAIDPVESLVDQLGGLVDELADEPIETYTARRAERMEFPANWKIYTDNFVEGYHIPGIHPAFFRAIDFAKFETTAERGYVRMTAPPRDGLFYRGLWLWMWPNWTLSLFEGGMNTSRINPLAVDRTELLYTFYFADQPAPSAAESGSSTGVSVHAAAIEAARAATIEANLAIIREDFGICLDTHRNYASGGYTPGPLSPHHEQGVAWFQTQLRAARSRAGNGHQASGNRPAHPEPAASVKG